MLNLNDLLVFITAAECKTFSEAGRRLHLSQPAISQTIEKLEKEFETRLFLRQGRRVRLSESGQVLLPMARELLANANRLEESMASLSGEMIGEIVVGCATSVGKYRLPGLIAGFRQAFPFVRIDLQISDQADVLERLHSGEIALAISSQRSEHRHLECRDFFEDEIILIAAPGHPWTACREITPLDLLETGLILREEASGTRQALFNGLRRHRITPDMLTTEMTLENAETVVMAVEEALGVAFVSRLSAVRSLELGRVVEIKVAGLNLSRKIYLLRNQRFPQTQAQSAFWQFITQNQPGGLVPSGPVERQPA